MSDFKVTKSNRLEYLFFSPIIGHLGNIPIFRHGLFDDPMTYSVDSELTVDDFDKADFNISIVTSRHHFIELGGVGYNLIKRVFRHSEDNTITCDLILFLIKNQDYNFIIPLFKNEDIVKDLISIGGANICYYNYEQSNISNEQPTGLYSEREWYLLVSHMD